MKGPWPVTILSVTNHAGGTPLDPAGATFVVIGAGRVRRSHRSTASDRLHRGE